MSVRSIQSISSSVLKSFQNLMHGNPAIFYKIKKKNKKKHSPKKRFSKKKNKKKHGN